MKVAARDRRFGGERDRQRPAEFGAPGQAVAVDALARRIASYDRPAIAAAKAIVNASGGIPSAAALQSTQAKFFDMLTWPSAQGRIAALFAQGFSSRSDLEMNFGARLGAA